MCVRSGVGAVYGIPASVVHGRFLVTIMHWLGYRDSSRLFAVLLLHIRHLHTIGHRWDRVAATSDARPTVTIGVAKEFVVAGLVHAQSVFGRLFFPDAVAFRVGGLGIALNVLVGSDYGCRCWAGGRCG